MILQYDEQTCVLVDKKSKTKHINVTYSVEKKSDTDIFYFNILADVLSKTTSKLGRNEFNCFKYDMYNAIFSIDVKDYKERIILNYSLNFIDPEYVIQIDENELINQFINFIDNKKIDKQQISIALNTQKLIIEDIKQDYPSLIDRLVTDELLKNFPTYLTLKKTEDLIENFDIQKLHEVLEYQRVKLFSFMKAKKDTKIQPVVASNTNREKISRYNISCANDKKIKKDVDQPIIYLTFKLEDVDYFTKLVFSAMLGMGSHSLLFKIIREQQNLCYYVYSKTIYENGMQIISGINKEKVELFLTKTDEILQDETLFTEELLQTSKDYLISIYQKKNNDYGFNQQIVINHFLFGLPQTPEEIIKKIESVKLSNIKDALMKVQKVNKMVLGD